MSKLIEIINEEIVKSFRNIEYDDDDIINPDEIDLRSEYNKLNAQLFNDRLPEVPIMWGGRKTALGHVTANINKRTGEIIIKSLTISNFRALPYRSFLNVLAHEMIHVELFDDGYYNPNDHHDYRFMSEARRINGMGLGLNITKRNDEPLGVSDVVKARTKGKRMIAVLLNIDGKTFGCTTTESAYNSEFGSIVYMYQNFVNQGKYNTVEITVINSANSELLRFPMKRTFRRGISYVPISRELYDQLLGDYELFHKKIVKGALYEEDSEWEEIIVS
jgi:hypothetical protein